MIAAVVGFDEDCFRCAGELEHSCKQHSSKQTDDDIHTTQFQTCMVNQNEFLKNEFGVLNCA